MIEELVYNPRVRQEITKLWPKATFEDASDMVHEGRFSVKIQDIEEDEFYEKAVKEGWSVVCLGFMLRIKDEEFKRKVEGWLGRPLVKVKEVKPVAPAKMHKCFECKDYGIHDTNGGYCKRTGLKPPKEMGCWS
ncbi:hypothetical protein LCGC14_0146300 [marine sediment metagenome]|uniref:Uncharacterized protein n=1 Tax=marine sediment metagenome TaxID=412755 RepID=A0A0F9V3F7_9ZZZZ